MEMKTRLSDENSKIEFIAKMHNPVQCHPHCSISGKSEILYKNGSNSAHKNTHGLSTVGHIMKRGQSAKQ